jgi:hypothetical protein
VNDKSVVYAPVDHGARINDGTGALDPNVYSSGSLQVRKLKDGYLADRTGILRIVPTSADYIDGSPYHGRRVLQITPSDYPVGTATDNVTYGPQVCKGNAYCNKPGFSDRCEITCTQPETHSYDYVSAQTPNRLYVRAFARTQIPAICNGTSDASLSWQRRGKCIERLAYTNPVWIVRKPLVIRGDIGGLATKAILGAR